MPPIFSPVKAVHIVLTISLGFIFKHEEKVINSR